MAKSIRDKIEEQLDKLKNNLTDARASLVYWESQVKEYETEVAKLQGALDSLDGRKKIMSAPQLETPHIASSPWTLSAPIPATAQVTLNGEPIILEPGMRIGHNSLGEECIMPEGVPDPPRMEEPIAPVADRIKYPSAFAPGVETSGDSFAAPEDLY